MGVQANSWCSTWGRRAEEIRGGLAAGSEHRGSVSVLCTVPAAEPLKSTEGKSMDSGV